MLTAAALGMLIYGVYSAGFGVMDLVVWKMLEAWADVALLLFGALLAFAAALVRALVPGGLALAIGAMLALQALGIHTAAHVTGEAALPPQILRGVFAGVLVVLAHAGGRLPPQKDT